MPYAIKLARALEPYNLKWMEEFLPPDDYEGYEEVKKALGGTQAGWEYALLHSSCVPFRTNHGYMWYIWQYRVLDAIQLVSLCPALLHCHACLALDFVLKTTS